MLYYLLLFDIFYGPVPDSTLWQMY